MDRTESTCTRVYNIHARESSSNNGLQATELIVPHPVNLRDKVAM